MDGLKDSVIQMLAGEGVRINTGTFSNDMTTFATKDDVLTLLVHLGYLTYNSETEKVTIPNKEVSQEYLNAISTMDWHEDVYKRQVLGRPGEKKIMANAYCRESGIALEAETDCCGVQFYAGNFIGEQTGKGGASYHDRSAFCLESQFYPNAVNEPDFPSPVVKAGDRCV